MFEQFTDRARKIVAISNNEAQRFCQEYIAPEHVLLGLLKADPGTGANALKALQVDLRSLRLHLERLCSRGEIAETRGKIPQTPKVRRVIEHAINEARNLGHNYVGSEHLLLGLLREPDTPAAEALRSFGVTLEAARAQICKLLDGSAWPAEYSSTGPLASTIKELLTTHDQALREISKEVSECIERGETDKIAALKARYEHIAGARMQELLDRIGRDGFFSRALAEAIRSTPPDQPISPARLLVAIIQSDASLNAALARFLPQIAKALQIDLLDDRPRQ